MDPVRQDFSVSLGERLASHWTQSAGSFRMFKLPRAAVGTSQGATDPVPMIWALSHALRMWDVQTQLFHAQAMFGPWHGASVICGLSARYLDSWLMSPELCRETFVHSAKSVDLSLVLGRFEGRNGHASRGGSLEELCRWLELPKVVILDVSRLDACALPGKPPGTRGLLLDRVPARSMALQQTRWETLWGVPVLGMLPELAEQREKVGQLRAAQPSDARCVCEALGRCLARTFDTTGLLDLAAHVQPLSSATWAFQPRRCLEGLTVAVAYDDAFHGYFPDVLDLLEIRGASVVDFSPLHSGALPPGTDVVYIGCGHPEQHVEALVANECLAVALRDHVQNGGRLYAEGGGLAYLCRSIQLATNHWTPMAGVLPAVAFRLPQGVAPRATEIILARDHWLAPRGTRLRGYINPTWHFEPAGALTAYAGAPNHPFDLLGHRQAFGSRLHLNFATQPDFLGRFSSGRSEASHRVTFGTPGA